MEQKAKSLIAMLRATGFVLFAACVFAACGEKDFQNTVKPGGGQIIIDGDAEHPWFVNGVQWTQNGNRVEITLIGGYIDSLGMLRQTQVFLDLPGNVTFIGIDLAGTLSTMSESQSGSTIFASSAVEGEAEITYVGSSEIAGTFDALFDDGLGGTREITGGRFTINQFDFQT